MLTPGIRVQAIIHPGNAGFNQGIFAGYFFEFEHNKGIYF
jgi:hypothetical protein